MTNMDAVTVALTNERNGYSIFDADYDPSPEAIAKVNEVFDFIEANPEKWDQNSYGNHLSETNCFMGIVSRLSGIRTAIHCWFDDNGDDAVADDFHEFSLLSAMDILGMGSHEYMDRAEYIADFLEVRVYFNAEIHEHDSYYPYRMPTLDEMRERVSIALNHDFRKPVENDKPSLKVGENGSFPQAFNEV